MSLNLTILNGVLFFVYLLISLRFSDKLKLIDYLTETKMHSKPTPAIGGLVFFLIYLTIYFQLLLNPKLNEFYHYLTILSFFVFLIGYFDDVNNNNPYLKSFLKKIISY